MQARTLQHQSQQRPQSDFNVEDELTQIALQLPLDYNFNEHTRQTLLQKIQQRDSGVITAYRFYQADGDREALKLRLVARCSAGEPIYQNDYEEDNFDRVMPESRVPTAPVFSQWRPATRADSSRTPVVNQRRSQ